VTGRSVSPPEASLHGPHALAPPAAGLHQALAWGLWAAQAPGSVCSATAGGDQFMTLSSQFCGSKLLIRQRLWWMGSPLCHFAELLCTQTCQSPLSTMLAQGLKIKWSIKKYHKCCKYQCMSAQPCQSLLIRVLGLGWYEVYKKEVLQALQYQAYLAARDVDASQGVCRVDQDSGRS
jgi:hypothetical protein